MTTTGTIKITRVFEDPYTHVENAILRDTRMSLATRGFFALCLGLKQNQALTVGYFAKVAGVNKDTVVKHFQVLEKLGYLRRRQEHDEAGKFSATVYEFFTRPEEAEPYPKNSDTDTVSEKTVSEKTVTGFFRTKEITKERNNNPPIVPHEVKTVFDAYAGDDQELRDALEGLAENRETLKKPMRSERSARLLLKKLDKLSGGDRALKIALLEKAVTSNWLTVYPLRDREVEELRRPRASPETAGVKKRWVGTRIVDGEEVDVYE